MTSVIKSAQFVIEIYRINLIDLILLKFGINPWIGNYRGNRF